MEEIVVTAQRREERLQDVPISISVLSGTDLDSSPVQGLAEALRGVPGIADVPASRGGNMPMFSIRGVSGNSSFATGGSTIGYYLDSIPFGFVKSAFSPEANPYDLDRTEILRGPQGTLYGVSALNGVLRILTKDANLSAFELKGRASAASTDHGADSYRGDMAVNVPLVENKLAVRAALGYQDVGGWIDKSNDPDANDALIKTGRLKLNAQPTDTLSVGLSAWFSRGDYGSPPISPDGYQTPAHLEYSAQDYDAYSAKLDYRFSGVSLTSATSYIDLSTGWRFDASIPVFRGAADAYFPITMDGEVFSQEINLASTLAGPWQWTAGSIYRDSKESYIQGFIPFIPVLVNEEYSSESFAIFGELTRFFLDGRFGVTAGLRYFEDEVTDTDFLNAAGPSSKTDRFDAVSPRVVLNWRPSDQTTVYGSYGEGFRSGLNQFGVLLRALPFFPPAEPDTLKNYEIGAKTNLWGGRASVQTAIFYMDWQDVQQFLGVRIQEDIAVVAYVNAPSASGMGFELAATVEPIDELMLSVTVGWNDLTFDEDVFSQGLVLYPKGSRLNNSPETTAAVSADYALPLGGGYRGRLSASANYVSKQQSVEATPVRVLVGEGDSMVLARAGIALESPNRWTATLFADNLFNNNDIPVRDKFSNLWHTRVRPRTIGLQIEYRY